jgi:simple sugar transport system permease protein
VPDETREPTITEQITGVRASLGEVLLVPVLAVFTALLVGALILILTNPDMWQLLRAEGLGEWIRQSVSTVSNAYSALFQGAFGSTRAVSETLVASSPVILTGLAVALGFRAGLFNIGGEGQMLMGGFFSIVIGFWWGFLPFPIHLLAALAAGALGGAIWGGIAGILKARTGAHEVITTIMLNFVATFLVLYLLKTSFVQNPGRDDPISKGVEGSAHLPRLLTWIDPQLRVHAGIVLAFAAAWFAWWLLFRSTIGFEFRAVGYNPDAARYAGMRVATLYVAVMAVSGALAGLGGADVVLGVTHRGSPGFSAGVGFDGITVALLGRSHPAGVVLAGLLFGALEAGGREMQVQTQISVELVQIVQALVLLFVAAPALIRGMYGLRKPAEEAQRLTTGWGA